MSQSSNTDVTQLHCSICSGFLSCSPVRVLPNGTFICGQCSPPSDSSTYRAQALETLLEKASFPCRFGGRGCTEYFMFGQTVEHELKCEYRSFPCPFAACSLKESTSEMFKHFTEAHQDQVLENATLKLEVNQNAEGVVSVLIENIAFVVKYQYVAKDTHFTYDIRFCKNDSILGASNRLHLINTSDPENTISLKAVDCSVFDDSFRSSQKVQKINLKKFLQCLDHPTSVLISLHFTINSNKNSRKRKRDYEMPFYLKCKSCRRYLIPPLFLLNEDENKDVFCSICAGITRKSYLPLIDEQLLGALNTTMFPCRWHNCKFVTKNKNLLKHQVECQFREYNCHFSLDDCGDTFTLASAANHYKEKHGYQYTEKEIIFETSFAKCHGDRDIFTIKKHTIVTLSYSVSKENDCNTLILSLYSSEYAEFRNSSIHFEHQHCKAKSDSFEMTDGIDLKITLDKLPVCFKKEDVLTGFLTI